MDMNVISGRVLFVTSSVIVNLALDDDLTQDYYIMQKLGWADRSFYEVSAVVEFHKLPFIFGQFGPF